MVTVDGSTEALGIVRFGPEALDCHVDRVPCPQVPRASCGSRATDELADRFQDAIRLCESIAPAARRRRSFALERRADGIALESGALVLTDATSPATSMAVRSRACWRSPSAWKASCMIARLQATSPLDALLFDACASSMTEEAAQAASQRIAELADEAGVVPTKRFSPGFGDLTLELQDAFLQTIDAGKLLGIHAGSSHLMTPMKSVTAIVGLKPDPHA